MLAALTAVLLAAAPESFADQAHRQLARDALERLAPNLKSYTAIADDLQAQLTVLDDAQKAIATLDALRQTRWAEGLENTIPGFPWLLKTFDRLRQLSDRLAQVKQTMARLRETAEALRKASERYGRAPGDDLFRSLIRGLKDAETIFDDAELAFRDVDGFIESIQSGLTKARGAVDAIIKVPLVGEYAVPLRDDITGLAAKLQLVRGVIDLAKDAIVRDRSTVKHLQGTMAEARAHDAYVAARSDAESGRPGSALAAFREVRARWPDTQWAHRADRRIVTLVQHIDTLEKDLEKARVEQERLEAALADQRRQTNAERSRADNAKTALGRAGDVPFWPLVAGIAALLLGLIFTSTTVSSRRVRRS